MIYLVEDDESIRELVVYTLKSQDLDAKGFEKPSLFWKELDKELPAKIKRDIAKNHVKFYTLNGDAIGQKLGLGTRINMVMQAAFFADDLCMNPRIIPSGGCLPDWPRSAPPPGLPHR